MSDKTFNQVPSFGAQLFSIFLRQWYLVSRSAPRLLNDIMWPAIDLLTWGVMGLYIATIKPDSTNMLVVGVLFYQFFIRVEMNFISASMEDVWSKSLLHTFMAPISEWAYIVGVILITLLRSFPGLLVALIVGLLLFKVDFSVIGFQSLWLFLPLLLTAWGIGLMLGSSLFRFGNAAEWLVWPVGSLLFPLYAVFYPLSVFPLWLQKLTIILPPSYVFEQLRALGHGGSIDVAHYMLALVLSGVWFLLGVVCYKRGLNYMRKMGNLLVMGE